MPLKHCKMRNKITQLFLLFAIITLAACSPTNYLNLTVTEPAPVNMPADVKSVGILDRTAPSDHNSTLDKIDKILTVEGKDLDADGAKEVLNGCYNELGFISRIEKVELIDSTDVKGNGLGIFPAALSWDKVEQLCKENGVDVLYVLEFYDTDSKVAYSTSQGTSTNAFGLNVPITNHHATITTNIKMGWRIYDPLNKILIDEFILNQPIVSKGSGLTPLAAVKAVQGRKQGVMTMSRRMGENYSKRILDYNLRVSRHYYVRGSNSFRVAMRRARTGDWEGAAELWEMELLSPKRKAAGRAHYNMAIISEIRGDLDAAIEWASKAYSDYNDRRALRYVNILRNRKFKNQMLQE